MAMLVCVRSPARRAGPNSEELTARWGEAMRQHSDFLVQQQSQNTEVAATLTVLELPNLFALLDLVQRTEDAIGLATSLGRPRLLERVGQVPKRASGSRSWTNRARSTNSEFCMTTTSGAPRKLPLSSGKQQKSTTTPVAASHCSHSSFHHFQNQRFRSLGCLPLVLPLVLP